MQDSSRDFRIYDGKLLFTGRTVFIKYLYLIYGQNTEKVGVCLYNVEIC